MYTLYYLGTLIGVNYSTLSATMQAAYSHCNTILLGRGGTYIYQDPSGAQINCNPEIAANAIKCPLSL